MYLKYGTYSHASNEVELVIRKQPLYTKGRDRYAVTEMWTITGKLEAADASALTTALALLETAYRSDGLDVGLFNDDNSATAHRILASSTLGGIRVLDFSYPIGNGTEYVNLRTYTIVLEAVLPVAGVELIDWQETVTITGGGPRFVVWETRNGDPVRQQVSQTTPFKAVQAGRAVGFRGYPTPPAPLWPNDLHTDQSPISREAPTRQSGPFRDWPVSWQYVFESASPLAGFPTKQPRK